MQAMNLILYVAPSAYTLSKECRWLGGFVSWSGFLRWTLWNLVGSAISFNAFDSGSTKKACAFCRLDSTAKALANLLNPSESGGHLKSSLAWVAPLKYQQMMLNPLESGGHLVFSQFWKHHQCKAKCAGLPGIWWSPHVVRSTLKFTVPTRLLAQRLLYSKHT